MVNNEKGVDNKMAQSFDPGPLEAFFKEVSEQLGIELKYLPDNLKFPIQLENAPNGIARAKCIELLQFIKGQVDLRDNEIGEFYASKTNPGKFLFDIRMEAAKALADVYAMSFFIPHEEEEEATPKQKKTKKSKSEQEQPKKQKE